jgi:hypothetical protein
MRPHDSQAGAERVCRADAVWSADAKITNSRTRQAVGLRLVGRNGSADSVDVAEPVTPRGEAVAGRDVTGTPPEGEKFRREACFFVQGVA